MHHSWLEARRRPTLLPARAVFAYAVKKNWSIGRAPVKPAARLFMLRLATPPKGGLTGAKRPMLRFFRRRRHGKNRWIEAASGLRPAAPDGPPPDFTQCGGP